MDALLLISIRFLALSEQKSIVSHYDEPVRAGGRDAKKWK